MAATVHSGMSAELLRDRRELTFYMSLIFTLMVCQIQFLPENYKANKWSDFAARFDLTYPVLFLQYFFPRYYLKNKRPIIALYSLFRSAITVPTWDIGWDNVRPRNVLYLNLFLLLSEPIRSGTILLSDSAAFDILRNALYCLPLLYTRGHVLAGRSVPLWIGLVPLYLMWGAVLPVALMGGPRAKIRAERARLLRPSHGKDSYSSFVDVGVAASMKLDGLYPEDIHECSAEIESNLRAQLIRSDLSIPVAISIEAVRGCVLLAASVTVAGATPEQVESLSTLLKGLSMDQILPERIRERIWGQSLRSQAPAVPGWAAGLVQHINAAAGQPGQPGATSNACTLSFPRGSILLEDSPSLSVGGGLDFGLDLDLSVPGFDLSSLDTALLRGVLWASDGSWLIRPEPLVLSATWTRDPSSDAIRGHLTIPQGSIQPGEHGLTGLMAAVGLARSAEDDHMCGLLPLRAAAVAFSSKASAAAEQAAEHGGTALCADLGHMLHASRQRPLGAAALGGPWVALSDRLVRYSTNARLGTLSKILDKVAKEVRRPRTWASDGLGRFTDRALESEYRPVFFGAVLKTNAMALLGGLPAVYGSKLKHGIWCGVIAYSIGFLALGGARVAGLHRARPQLMSPLIAACQCLGHWYLAYSGKLYCEHAGEMNYGTVALLGYLGLFLYALSFTNELPWAAVLSLSSQIIQTVTYFEGGCHSRHNDIFFLIISDIVQTAGVLTALYVIYLRDRRMRGSFLRDRRGMVMKSRGGKAAPISPASAPTSAKKID